MRTDPRKQRALALGYTVVYKLLAGYGWYVYAWAADDPTGEQINGETGSVTEEEAWQTVFEHMRQHDDE